MNIGIITFTNTINNYGQVLQAYALRHYLQIRGHNVFHINYVPVCYKSKVFLKKKYASNIKSFIRHIIVENIVKPYRRYKGDEFEKKGNRDFQSFKEKYLNLYPKFYSSLSEIQEDFPKADAYICGSDQIWNTGTDACSEPFYLNFGEEQTLRIAYAPSFGKSEVSQSYISFLQKQLSHFDLVSVREESGLKICNCAGRNDAIHVVDPTLLLNKNCYRNLYSSSSVTWSSKNKLMVYLINFRFKKDICWNEILTIVDKLKLDLKLTLASGAYPARDILGWKNYFFPSPGEWLHSIEECDYFITNSFHGVVFAVIFHKQFLYIPIRGNNVGMNDRIFSLLDTLGLKQQIYDSGNMMCVQLQNIIDWNFVDKSLAEQRKIADNFFKIKNI